VLKILNMAKNLIDSNTFFIDSNVYIHIGLDIEAFLFNCVVCITSNSQCVKMSVELYQSLNTVLNNINFLLPSHLLLKEFKFILI